MNSGSNINNVMVSPSNHERHDNNVQSHTPHVILMAIRISGIPDQVRNENDRCSMNNVMVSPSNHERHDNNVQSHTPHVILMKARISEIPDQVRNDNDRCSLNNVMVSCRIIPSNHERHDNNDQSLLPHVILMTIRISGIPDQVRNDNERCSLNNVMVSPSNHERHDDNDQPSLPSIISAIAGITKIKI